MQELSQILKGILYEYQAKLSEISENEACIKLEPKKWSKKEILGHLIDSACNNHQKFVRMMNESELHFVGYRQDEWVASQNYNWANWHNLIELWFNYNLHISYIMSNISPKALQNVIYIEEDGPFTLEFILNDYPKHLLHHLKQIFPDDTSN